MHGPPGSVGDVWARISTSTLDLQVEPTFQNRALSKLIQCVG